MNVALQRRMTVPEFLDWALTQSKGSYELVDGKVVAMAPERAAHVLIKVAVVRALQDAIAERGLDCIAFGDGMTVRIDDYNGREPDVVVQCGRPFDPDALTADEPLIVVEVVSPSSIQTDNVDKLAEYFSVLSICHYLVVNPAKRFVIHHERGQGGKITTEILRAGSIELNPPGIAISIDAIFAALPS